MSLKLLFAITAIAALAFAVMRLMGQDAMMAFKVIVSAGVGVAAVSVLVISSIRDVPEE